MVLLSTYEPLPLGERAMGLEIDGVWLGTQPFVPLRTVTREEWIAAEVKEYPTTTLREAEAFADQNPYFYEISVD